MSIMLCVTHPHDIEMECGRSVCSTWLMYVTQPGFQHHLHFILISVNPSGFQSLCLSVYHRTLLHCIIPCLWVQSRTALCDYLCWDPCGMTLFDDTVWFSHILFSSYHTSMTYHKRGLAWQLEICINGGLSQLQQIFIIIINIKKKKTVALLFVETLLIHLYVKK